MGGQGIEGGVKGRRVTGQDVGARCGPAGVRHVVVEAHEQQVALARLQQQRGLAGDRPAR